MGIFILFKLQLIFHGIFSSKQISDWTIFAISTGLAITLSITAFINEYLAFVLSGINFGNAVIILIHMTASLFNANFIIEPPRWLAIIYLLLIVGGLILSYITLQKLEDVKHLWLPTISAYLVIDSLLIIFISTVMFVEDAVGAFGKYYWTSFGVFLG
jgi:hypothetical protein